MSDRTDQYDWERERDNQRLDDDGDDDADECGTFPDDDGEDDQDGE